MSWIQLRAVRESELVYDEAPPSEQMWRLYSKRIVNKRVRESLIHLTLL